MIRFETLLEKVRSYSPEADLELLRRAYVFSALEHKGQVRHSGEPYLVHPLEVADSLADMKLDVVAVAAGLLHDVVEDTLTTPERIQELFGKEIAHVVEGVTKIGAIPFSSSEERQAENFRKMLLAMVDDIRVILVKLADRLHNMRTLHHLPEERRIKIAQETLDIYAPIANRLGMSKVKNELEELSFKYLEPKSYEALRAKVEARAQERRGRDRRADPHAASAAGRGADPDHHAGWAAQAPVQHSLEANRGRRSISSASTISSRFVSSRHQSRIATPRSASSIRPGRRFPAASRTSSRCRGPTVISRCTPRSSAITDFPSKCRFEPRRCIAARRKALPRTGNTRKGASATTATSATSSGCGSFSRCSRRSGIRRSSSRTSRSTCIRKRSTSSRRKARSARCRAAPRRWTSPTWFTPTSATSAWAPASTAGWSPLRTRLQNGDIVEIVTQSGHKPSRDWLSFVVTSRARSKIKHVLQAEERTRSVDLGRRLFDKEARRFGLNPATLLESPELAKFASEYGAKSSDELLAHIGYGKLAARTVLQKSAPNGQLREDSAVVSVVRRVLRTGSASDKIKVRGTDDVMVFRAKCCNPIRGERIVGYITRGKGVSVHSLGCPNVLNLMFDPERRIDVEWDSAGTDQAPYVVRLTMQVEDRKGMLAEISARVSDINTNITNMEARTGDDRQARIDMTVEIRDVKHLEKVIKSIKGVQGVLGVGENCASAELRKHSYRVDFDLHVARQARDLHGRACRRRSGDVPAVDLVHRGEVAHVREEHRRSDDVLEPGAGRSQ